MLFHGSVIMTNMARAYYYIKSLACRMLHVLLLLNSNALIDTTPCINKTIYMLLTYRFGTYVTLIADPLIALIYGLIGPGKGIK